MSGRWRDPLQDTNTPTDRLVARYPRDDVQYSSVCELSDFSVTATRVFNPTSQEVFTFIGVKVTISHCDNTASCCFRNRSQVKVVVFSAMIPVKQGLLFTVCVFHLTAALIHMLHLTAVDIQDCAFAYSLISINTSYVL